MPSKEFGTLLPKSNNFTIAFKILILFSTLKFLLNNPNTVKGSISTKLLSFSNVGIDIPESS